MVDFVPDNTTGGTADSGSSAGIYAAFDSQFVNIDGGILVATGGAGNNSYGIYNSQSNGENNTVTATGGILVARAGSGTNTNKAIEGTLTNTDTQIAGQMANGTFTGSSTSYNTNATAVAIVPGGYTVQNDALTNEDNAPDYTIDTDTAVVVNNKNPISLTEDGSTVTLNKDLVLINLQGTSLTPAFHLGTDATVSGSGTLTAIGGSNGEYSYGIFGNGKKLSVNGAKVVAIGGATSKYSYGIGNSAYVNVSNSGSVIAIGGAAGNTDGCKSYGISDAVAADSGTINAIGGTAAASYGVFSDPAYANSTVTVTGGMLNAVGGVSDDPSCGVSVPSVTVADAGMIHAVGRTYGLSAQSGSLAGGSFTGGTAAIQLQNAGSVSALLADGCGYYAGDSQLDGSSQTVGDSYQTITVKPVTPAVTEAQWGDSADSLTEKGTLADAFAASPAYIRLQSSVTLAAGITVTDGTTTLDLNGQTITGAVDVTPITVSGGALTITDTAATKGGVTGGNGKEVDSGAGNDGLPAVSVSSGTLTVDAEATFTGGNGSDGAGDDGARAGGRGGNGIFVSDTGILNADGAFAAAGGAGGDSGNDNGGTGGRGMMLSSGGTLHVNAGITLTGGAGGTGIFSNRRDRGDGLYIENGQVVSNTPFTAEGSFGVKVYTLTDGSTLNANATGNYFGLYCGSGLTLRAFLTGGTYIGGERGAAIQLLFSPNLDYASLLAEGCFYTDGTTDTPIEDEDTLAAAKTLVVKTSTPAATHTHPVCGDSDCNDHGGNITWTAWDGTDELPDQEGNYYLTNNVVLSQTWSIGNKNIKLDLNGHSITSGAFSTDRSLEFIKVDAGGSLAVTDCNPQDGSGISASSATNAVFGIYSSGDITLTGGAKLHAESSSRNATAVRMYSSANLTISGDAEISVKTTDDNNAYGVDNDGTCTTTVTEDAKINAESERNAHGIYSYGTVVVNGNAQVTATSNATSTTFYACGIEHRNNSDGSVTVSGNAKVTGTDSHNASYGIYNARNGAKDSAFVAVTEHAAVSGTKHGVYNYGLLKLSGAPAISGGTEYGDVTLLEENTGAKIVIAGALTYTTPLRVYGGKQGPFTSGWSAYMSQANPGNYFVSTDDAYHVILESEELKFATAAPTTYTVTVTNDGNGTASASPSSAAAGTEITLTATADSGYHFKEWQVISGGITVSNNKFTMPASDVEIKAVFEQDAPDTHTVTFNMNGHGTAIDPVTVSSGEKVTKPTDPTATGYTFDGWFKEQACTNEWDFDNDTVNGNTTLYAKWTAETYSVMLNANGGAISSGNVTSYTYGVGATLPTADDMAKDGHRFGGWYESADFSGSPVTTIPSTATGDKVYYAKWIAQHTVSGTITGKDDIQYSNVSAKLIALGGDTVNINSISKDSAEGVTPEVYTFSNVTVDAGQYNLVVTATDTTNNGKEVTVTALVDLTEQDATVTLALPDSAKSSTVKTSNGNIPRVIAGGMDQLAEETDIPDDASSITIKLTVDEKQDAEVVGDAEKIAAVAGGQTIDLYLDIQLQLFKDEETTGTDLGSTNTQILKLLVPADTSKTGLTVYRVHDGKAEAMQKDSPDANGEYFTLGDGFVTIYAKKFSVYALGYTPDDTYTITLDANGGTVNGGGTATLVTGADKKLSSLPTPTRSGSYTFDGWFTAASGGEKVTTDKEFASNQTIYAHWTYTGSTGDGGGYTPTYSITVEKAENGKVEANRSSASSGSTVTLTVTPEDGYVLDRLTVTDSRGNNIEATDKGNGTYTFKMPSRKVTVEAVFVPDGSFSTCTGGSACPIYPYTDADPAAWYHDGVHYCIENGLMAGYGNNIFKPDAATTRGMLAVMLWRLEGSPVVNYALNFEDVAEGQWYTEAIRWAVSEGIATGYGNGYFGTNDAITREQLAAMLWRYAGSPESSRSLDHFGDAMEVSGYAVEALAWANEHGIVVGVGNNTLSPQSHATRAQVATMLMRMVQATTK